MVTDSDSGRNNSGMDVKGKASRKGKLPMLINLDLVNVEDYKRKNTTKVVVKK